MNTSGTSVTLRGLAPNTQYVVEVAAISSIGAISNFSAIVPFTLSPTTTAQPGI